jgi:hypothetical protein
MELQLVFKTAQDKKKIITITDPREDVSLEEANAAMQVIIEKNIFESSYGDLLEIVEARLHNCEYTVLL